MASKAVFADSAFFFALAAKQDLSHEAATESLHRLLRLQRRIVTSDYIVDEALTLTRARTNSVTALRLLDRIERSELIEIEWITSEYFSQAKTFFRKHADHSYSFTDCTSFVLMRELGLSEALTNDRHFREAGFRLLLPLA